MSVSALVFDRPEDIQTFPCSGYRVAGEDEEQYKGEVISHSEGNCCPYRSTYPRRMRSIDESAIEEENGNFGKAERVEKKYFGGPSHEA